MTLNDTLDFIKIKHEGQVDKSGEPYWKHPHAVSHIVSVLQLLYGSFPGVNPEHEQHAALLHDVVEDTEISFQDLLDMSYPQEVVDMVKLVSKDEDDCRTYQEKIQSIIDSGNLGAIRVKFADNINNLDPGRLAKLPNKQAQYLRKKYSVSASMLKSALEKVRNEK